MRHEHEAEDRDWERVSRAFFRRLPPPTPVQTEAFVARVMARLPAPLPPPLAWLTGRWLVPAMGLGFAVLALSFRPYARAQAQDPASALLVASSERAAGAFADAPADLSGLDAEER